MKKIFVCLISICMIILLSGCGNGSLVGTWYYYDNGNVNMNRYYKFNDDKTGSYTSFDTKKTFLYEKKSGEVSLDNITDNVIEVYKYSINDDTLTMEDSNGSKVVYKKSIN